MPSSSSSSSSCSSSSSSSSDEKTHKIKLCKVSKHGKYQTGKVKVKRGKRGRSGIKWVGVWNSGSSYKRGNGVTYLGSSYVALLKNTNQNPVSATTYWLPVANGVQDQYAHFYGSSAVAVPASGTIIFGSDGNVNGVNPVATRASSSTFTIVNPGTYQVDAVVGIAEASGAIVLALGGVEQAYTLAGKNSGANTQVVISTIIKTTNTNVVLDIRNPSTAGGSITPQAVVTGAGSVVNSLRITKLY